MAFTYDMFLNGAQIASGVDEKTYTFTGLSAETSYTLGVRTNDRGYVSELSTTAVSTLDIKNQTIAEWQARLADGNTYNYLLTSDFGNKVAGNPSTNPSTAWQLNATTVGGTEGGAPELSQLKYDGIMFHGGDTAFNQNSGNNRYSQILTRQSIVNQITFHLGENFWLALGADTLAKRIPIAKTMFQVGGVTSYAKGFIGSTYKVTCQVWNNTAAAFTAPVVSNVNGFPAIYVGNITSAFLDANAMIFSATYSDPTSGSGTTRVEVDYIKLDFNILLPTL